MSDDKKPRKRKEPLWPERPDDEPHERARRAVNRMVYGIDSKQRIVPD
jgi:hypothetical protein